MYVNDFFPVIHASANFKLCFSPACVFVCTYARALESPLHKNSAQYNGAGPPANTRLLHLEYGCRSTKSKQYKLTVFVHSKLLYN